MTETLTSLLERTRIVPVVTIDDAAGAVPLVAALVRGGLTAVEITLRTDAALDAIGRAARVPGARVGAGSVTSVELATAAVEAGASFLVGPGFDPDVVDAALRLGVDVVPGVATATELQRAVGTGVRVVKLFPAALIGGVALVAALSAVWPDVRFVPTGGITPATAPDYLAAPQVLAVGGSWMVPRSTVAAQDWAAIERAAADAVRLVELGR